jgi:hypothetical protein
LSGEPGYGTRADAEEISPAVERASIRAESRDEVLQRLGRLEASVEVVMRTLATLGLESVLIELDEARGAYCD